MLRLLQRNVLLNLGKGFMCSDTETAAITDVSPTAHFSIISQRESRDSLITHSHTIVTAAPAGERHTHVPSMENARMTKRILKKGRDLFMQWYLRHSEA